MPDLAHQPEPYREAHPTPDPLQWQHPLPLRAVFYPLGFPVEIVTNAQPILDAAAESYRHRVAHHSEVPPLQLRFTVIEGGSPICPPAPIVRAYDRIVSHVSDGRNQFFCDIERGAASGWLDSATLQHRNYLRYHVIEACVLILLAASRAVPLHAACVSRNGHGILLCGPSGAGKSTLSYACARAGFTYTSDDSTYLLPNSTPPRVTGNAHQVRFRPAAKDLFPEIRHRDLTARAQGKPSIEVLTSTLPNLITSEEATVHSLVFLNRQSTSVELRPYPRELAWQHLFAISYPSDVDRFAAAQQQLANARIYELCYTRLDDAIHLLEQLASGRHSLTA